MKDGSALFMFRLSIGSSEHIRYEDPPLKKQEYSLMRRISGLANPNVSHSSALIFKLRD